jgi:hypothetical protein
MARTPTHQNRSKRNNKSEIFDTKVNKQRKVSHITHNYYDS